MDGNDRIRKLSRRAFLKIGGVSALALAGGEVIPALARQINAPKNRSVDLPSQAPLTITTPVYMRLAATDGFIRLPGRGSGGIGDEIYIFGFIEVPLGATIPSLDPYKGNVRMPAPIIGVDQESELYLTMTNLGFVGRPDLDDSHTVHWHGFRNPIALFDGVPEVSIAVPVARDFPYFYHPQTPGTFIYHCHFEDSEHVQMGMDGIVYVRPTQNDTGAAGGPIARLGGNPGSPVMGYAYNDGVDPSHPTSTAYDREFTLLLNEVDTRPHDGLLAVQEFVWSDYKPNFWIINGRSYPDTLLPNNDPDLPNQPVSSLIQVNEGDRTLLRFASLGYEQHAMQLTGIEMRVVGEDASFLQGLGGADLSYRTNTIYIGPGEARDVLFNAPAYIGPGAYDSYLLKNRNYHKQTNGGATGMGGMVTEVRVYPAGTLPLQTEPNETYP